MKDPDMKSIFFCKKRKKNSIWLLYVYAYQVFIFLQYYPPIKQYFPEWARNTTYQAILPRTDPTHLKQALQDAQRGHPKTTIRSKNLLMSPA